MLHHTRLERFASDKDTSLLGQFLRNEENKVLWLRTLISKVQLMIQLVNKECLLVRNHFADRHLVDKVEEEIGQPIHSCVNHCVDEMSVSQMSVGQMVFDQRIWNFQCIGRAHLKIVNNCLNANIYSYLETSGSQSSNL